MNIFICHHCGDERKSNKSLIQHERLCKKNSNKQISNTENARKAAATKVKCEYCQTEYSIANIRKHKKHCIKNPSVILEKGKQCPVCEKIFFSKSVTCSHSCSNTYFRHGREGGIRYLQDDVLIEKERYRDLCFRYHDKKCIICNEINIVSVHHLNENHNDNRPENLIPLCPTHHQYVHSNFKYLIEDIITKYVEQWKSECRP